MSIDPGTASLSEERINKLAKANLCRLRGEYDRAEVLCVEILQTNPDKVEAMAILGDICAERNELDKARHWYSMAADIKPPLPGVVDKLHQMDRRIQKEEQTHSAVVSIRAAYSRQKTATWVAVGAAMIALTAAVLSGMRHPAKNVRLPTVVLADSASSGSSTSQSKSALIQTPISVVPSPELTLLTKLDRPEVKQVTMVLMDPRSNTLVIVANGPSDGSYSTMAASLGVDGLQSFENASMVTIRLMDQGSLSFTADLKRSDYTKASSAGGTTGTANTQNSSTSNSSSSSSTNSDSASPASPLNPLLSNVWQAGQTQQANSLSQNSGS